MPTSGSWDVIFGADSSQAVLFVDFPLLGCHREAGFAELATLLGPGYRFLRTKPPAVRPGQKLSGDAYIGPWIESIQHDRQPVLAVLGYSVGSVYAAAIAEEIPRWQRGPNIILFDPQFASIELLGCELNRDINAISPLLSDDEIECARKIAAGLTGSGAGGIANVAAEMVELYLDAITAAFERAGLGSARGSKLTEPFQSYMSWISIAGQIDPRRTWKHSTAIVSSDYAGPPNGESPADRVSSPIGRKVPFEVGHADLLRSDCVAKAVLDLLEPR